MTPEQEKKLINKVYDTAGEMAGAVFANGENTDRAKELVADSVERFIDFIKKNYIARND